MHRPAPEAPKFLFAEHRSEIAVTGIIAFPRCLAMIRHKLRQEHTEAVEPCFQVARDHMVSMDVSRTMPPYCSHMVKLGFLLAFLIDKDV